jgi:hypothetical protein
VPVVSSESLERIMATAVKTYDVRGPLQQFRLPATHTFDCWRCGSAKTAKLLTIVDGDPERLLCNGCYGRLLALWEIKAGDLPDAERDLAVLELLAKDVPAAEIAAARGRLSEQSDAYAAVSPQAQLMLATAEAVTAALRHTSGLDWSAAIICLCKAVEFEVVRCVAEPWRDAAAALDLRVDLSDKDLMRVARYCAGTASAPELGVLGYTLGVAARSRSRRETSPLLGSLWRLADAHPGGSWIVDADGLPSVLADLSKTFRNPAAHTSLLTSTDYLRCRELVLGRDGILDRLVRSSAA